MVTSCTWHAGVPPGPVSARGCCSAQYPLEAPGPKHKTKLKDIAAYKTKLKDEREQKKQKTVQARAANLPADLTEQQRRRMGTPKTHAAKKRKSHEGQRLQPQPPKTDAAKKRKSHEGQ